MAGSSILISGAGGDSGADVSQPESDGSSLQTDEIFTIRLGFFSTNERMKVLSLEHIVCVDRTSLVMA